MGQPSKKKIPHLDPLPLPKGEAKHSAANARQIPIWKPPDEKKSFDALLQEVQATTAMPDDMQDVLPDKPRVDPAPATSMLNEIERSTAQALSKNPNATHEQSLLNDSAVSGRPQPALS